MNEYIDGSIAEKIAKLMNVLIHDYGGYSFIFGLSNALARRGYDILHVYTSSSGGPHSRFKCAGNASLLVKNITAKGVKKMRFLYRYKQELIYGYKLVEVLSERRPDIILSANTPLVAQSMIIRWADDQKIPFILWMQDIRSLAAESILTKRLGLLGFAVSRYFRVIDRKTLSNSNHVVTISGDFVSILEGWGVDTKRITIIPNWAPVEDIPVLGKTNGFSIRNQIADKFVVLYSGTMGMKHDPTLILKAAEALRDDKEIVFVVVSEGSGMEFLKESTAKQAVENLILLPFQPYEIFPEVLASADVLLTILEPFAGEFCVPSKVWSGFCAARPSVLVVPETNLAARVTKAAEAGIIIPPTDNVQERLSSSIRQLKSSYHQRLQMGSNARRYAETHFKIDRIADRFESVFERVLGDF